MQAEQRGAIRVHRGFSAWCRSMHHSGSILLKYLSNLFQAKGRRDKAGIEDGLRVTFILQGAKELKRGNEILIIPRSFSFSQQAMQKSPHPQLLCLYFPSFLHPCDKQLPHTLTPPPLPPSAWDRPLSLHRVI